MTKNIVTLGILSKQQADSLLENKLPKELVWTQQLPLRRERDITHMLAFLSATVDNLKRVIAVCIKENSQNDVITIKIASNTGDLIVIKDKFRRVARILENVLIRSK